MTVFISLDTFKPEAKDNLVQLNINIWLVPDLPSGLHFTECC